MATIHKKEYADGSKFQVSTDKNGKVYMTVFEGNVRDKDNHSRDDYQIGGKLNNGNAYVGGHGPRSEKKKKK